MTAEPHSLIAAASRGDDHALSELYDAFNGALYGVILRIVRREELAQEVLQDTFMKIWRNAGSYDAAKGRPFTWMVNIARNAAIDATRTSELKRSNSIQPIDRHVYALESDASLSPMESTDVRSVLAGMRQEHRDLIDLAYYKGYSQQEIANDTGLPLGTVKSRTRTALLELRTLLKDHR